eukprot:TRINITY_DN461_c0_g1_i1.p2 TRINITY_DN461_c0_g1~~TRINITY_DN461_c0_g1_i1.p2  ORF type:complete len:159 (-),score=43.83 TRINITY_DN461_c0_g1_i1:878-1354(-)
MPIKEWDLFHKGAKKNSSHYWVVCKACRDAGVEDEAIQVAGTADAMRAHLRKYANLPAEDEGQEQNGPTSNNSGLRSKFPVALKKRKLTQTTFEVAKADVAFAPSQFEEFERQSLYAALDANLAFPWTESEEVVKLFKMCKSSLKMPRRKSGFWKNSL